MNSTTRQHISGNRIGFFAAAVGLLLTLFVSPVEVRAERWMFRRSYFSHIVPAELQRVSPRPNSRSAYRRALVGTSPGFSVQGGYRINRIFLRSGNSTDLTVIREDWVRYRP